MCLILFALQQNRHYPLVVAANRDEFYQRPTCAMHWWPERDLLAGRDQRSGGTWLAVRRDGLVTAVTNVREGSQAEAARSRGELPLRACELNPADLGEELVETGGVYGGFNLVRLDASDGWYFSNRDSHAGRHLHRGLYGLSNHLLQSPWPKLIKMREELGELLSGKPPLTEKQLHDTLIEQLQDSTPAPDHLLPDTGVGIETERFLSSPFIRGDGYGTRATTIVTRSADGQVMVSEQTWLPQGRPGERQTFQWQLPAPN
ncbi:MAG: NRDE family protein [Marinobacter sp.]|uniref:NRDE family protein n=1 Tax=Marinobacter sp. TaxID=50741 RepID=UPI00299D318B|nr:NRDE family protein [Marinobacter sp.]MDX1635647.1 NRDE family protein [Marinobacter sp.]